jgi:hypothetical protein
VAELERTVVAMKRVVEKLQQENKRLLSERKGAVTERKVQSPLLQCRDSNSIKMTPLCLTIEALCYEDVWGSGCIDPRFLDLSTNWRLVVSFTPPVSTG